MKGDGGIDQRNQEQPALALYPSRASWLPTRFNRKAFSTIFIVVVVLLAAFLFGVFIWPTPYLIVHEKGEIFRVNRFTGVREWSTQKGWLTEEQMQANTKAEAAEKLAKDRAKVALLKEDLKQIRIDDVRGDINKIAIYNPSNWELRGSSYKFLD